MIIVWYVPGEKYQRFHFPNCRKLHQHDLTVYNQSSYNMV